MNNIYIEKRVSHKEGKEPFTYLMLYLDLGYTKVNLSMDRNQIAEILNVSVQDLFKLEENEPALVGELRTGKDLD